jgi:hypothetical protein
MSQGIAATLKKRATAAYKIGSPTNKKPGGSRALQILASSIFATNESG